MSLHKNKRMKFACQGPFTKNFPSDIIDEILWRLPTKSLMRFRTLSKELCRLIDSVYFANMHVLKQAETAAEEPQTLCLDLLSLEDDKPLPLHSLYIHEDTIKESERPVLELLATGDLVECVAFGLLCFRSIESEMYLYNPVRGEVLVLPSPWTDRLPTHGSTFYGLGFDNTTTSYKVVQVSENYFNRSSKCKWEVRVYTLGIHSWRVVPSTLLDFWNPTLLDFFNGFLNPSLLDFLNPNIAGLSAYGDMHWMRWNRIDKIPGIMSFDFRKEELKATQLPDFGRFQQHYKCFKLINLKGFLTVVSFPTAAHIDIWVLKDYAKNEWVKEHRISTTRVWAKEPDGTVVLRPDMLFWEAENEFFDYHCGSGYVYKPCQGEKAFVLDLKTNRIWYIKKASLPKKLYQVRAELVYTERILSLRNFGNPMSEVAYKYNFLKGIRSVYVSP